MRFRAGGCSFGNRGGIDTALLAAGTPPAAGRTLDDWGCGVGTAMPCAAHRVPGDSVTRRKVIANHADLAARNAVAACIATRIHCADLWLGVRQRPFDYVIMDPPDTDGAKGAASDDPD